MALNKVTLASWLKSASKPQPTDTGDEAWDRIAAAFDEYIKSAKVTVSGKATGVMTGSGEGPVTAEGTLS